jgi:prepilin-type N-terminal cleavage/methylation domain-containing protein
VIDKRRPRERGFTLIEMAVTMAIVVVLAGLAAVGMQRYKPRAGLASTAAQLTALLNAARQNALSTGNDTVVMFFTQVGNPLGGTGRVILYEDQTFNFFNGLVIPNFGAQNPASSIAPNSSSDAFETLDLPRGMSFGFGGVATPTLTAPYNLITAGSCSFCSASGRGAVVFDSRGRARFYNANGAPLAVAGGTVALQGSDVTGYRLVVITSTTGSIKAFNRG